MTFARLGLWDDKPFMAIMKGESVGLSEAEAQTINLQTDPTWPHVHARINGTFEQFLSVFPCNHVMGTTDDRVRSLVYLCEMAGITPVVLGPEGEQRLPPIWEWVR
jgi:L-fucose/D-arabinose isomerase